jgi:hypothetical protein
MNQPLALILYFEAGNFKILMILVSKFIFYFFKSSNLN